MKATYRPSGETSGLLPSASFTGCFPSESVRKTPPSFEKTTVAGAANAPAANASASHAHNAARTPLEIIATASFMHD